MDRAKGILTNLATKFNENNNNNNNNNTNNTNTNNSTSYSSQTLKKRRRKIANPTKSARGVPKQ